MWRKKNDPVQSAPEGNHVYRIPLYTMHAVGCGNWNKKVYWVWLIIKNPHAFQVFNSSFFGLTTVDKTVRDKIGIGKWRRGHLIPTRDVPTFFLEFSEWNPGDFWALDSMFRTTLANVLTRELLKTGRHFCNLLSVILAMWLQIIGE